MRRSKKQATATVMTTTAPAPPPGKLRTGRRIVVGAVEHLGRGRELRCFLERGTIVVALYEGGRRNPRELSVTPHPSRCATGASFDEGEFAQVLDSYYVNSPWHDGEHNSDVLTVDCLRRGLAGEHLVFKDLYTGSRGARSKM